MRPNQHSAIGIQHFPTGQLQVEEGVYYYGARFYDSALGRFISADTLIPQPGSPLAWDRYAYANNNPVKYTDPSGHCPTCIIGAVLGGITGGVAYTIATGPKANFAEGLLAVGVGAAGGALIGTGVGAGAGITLMSSVLIGAGTGVVGTQLAYTLTAGDKYNSTEMVLDSAVGGVTGAVSAGASSSLSPTAAFLVDRGLDAYAGGAQYQTHAMVNGSWPDPSKTLQSAGTGLLAGFAGEMVPATSFGKVPDIAAKIFLETVDDAARTTGVQVLQNYLDSGFPDRPEQKWSFYVEKSR